jgi:hypothetical protein
MTDRLTPAAKKDQEIARLKALLAALLVLMLAACADPPPKKHWFPEQYATTRAPKQS